MCFYVIFVQECQKKTFLPKLKLLVSSIYLGSENLEPGFELTTFHL